MCNPGTKEGVTVKDGRFAGVWPANEVFFNEVRGKGGLVGVFGMKLLEIGRGPVDAGIERARQLRSVDGAGLACAPSVSPSRFADKALQQGDDGRAVLEVLNDGRR